MVPLSLFLVSVSPIAAELEPLEDGCLLQKTKEQQLLVKEEQLRDTQTPGYEKVCGPNCYCSSSTGTPSGFFSSMPIGECAARCTDFQGFIFAVDPETQSAGCQCCNNVDTDPPNAVTTGNTLWDMYQYIGASASAMGDPHITTLDGKHYTLLSQGTFSLWHFSGLETELHSEFGTKKLPIDWQVYVHYSGHQSFTKGLLLIDKSGGSIRQVLEITSQDCKWKARKGNGDWRVVDNAELSIPDGKDYVTGFDLSSVGPRGHGGHGFPNRVRFNMYTKNGKSDIAVMSLSCRPSHNMNLQISMKRQSDQQFVDGELKVSRKSLSTLQTSTDLEFSMDSKWQELGGSGQAASYFQLVDTNQTSSSSFQSQGCGDAEKGLAKETCSKHLGEAHGTYLFEDCIYDVCHGGGETQAELAAELLAATKAD